MLAPHVYPTSISKFPDSTMQGGNATRRYNLHWGLKAMGLDSTSKV